MNKNIFCLFAIFFMQFLATSCDTCDCSPAKTFEIINKSLDVKAWDTSGFNNEEIIVQPVNKNSFGMSILVEFEEKRIAFSAPKINLSGLGFSAAYACDCVLDNFINNDPVSSIQILATDTNNKEAIDVTNNFTTYRFEDKISVKEYLETRVINDNNYYYFYNDIIQIDMTEYNDIPNSSIFTIKIILKSGTELIHETQEINFI